MRLFMRLRVESAKDFPHHNTVMNPVLTNTASLGLWWILLSTFEWPGQALSPRGFSKSPNLLPPSLSRSSMYTPTVLWSSSPLTNRVNAKQRPTIYKPVFDFSNREEGAVEKFERIDDAIMGGISLSSLKQVEGEEFARWSGICRLDGGGFCGTRSLPFSEPIQVREADGVYLSCRLTSDDEPERRVWKVTTRSEQSRGEQLYQSMFELPKSIDRDSWNRIQIPFASFQQVRGPRMVEGAEPLNTTNGLFQIGMSLSKFQIAKNVTEVPNFRPGFFELQVQEIGVYTNAQQPIDVVAPTTLSNKEIQKKKPLLLKIILPLASVFFSEKRRRRNSAMKILRKRGMSRMQATLFGFKMRLKRKGLIMATAQSMGMLCQDVLRATLFWTLRLSIIFPVRLLSRLVKGVRSSLRQNTTKQLNSTSR